VRANRSRSGSGSGSAHPRTWAFFLTFFFLLLKSRQSLIRSSLRSVGQKRQSGVESKNKVNRRGPQHSTAHHDGREKMSRERRGRGRGRRGKQIMCQRLFIVDDNRWEEDSAWPQCSRGISPQRQACVET
jgi:hypothetical protein